MTTSGADRPLERIHVAVVGSGHASDDECDQAARLGRFLAEAGAVVVCGGLGGVMEAVCRGVRGGGGLSIGVLPGSDRSAANPYVDVAVPTGMGEGRNVLVVRTADAVVAVGGEYGTLSEVALALQAEIPVIGLGTWELAKHGRAVDAVHRASSPEEAADAAVREAGRRRRLGT
ncbi:MAG TPA: TIGR00725 family protein [Acidimicrobiales bacterium]|nr:TIGR00725 family protein [Acidimicrobiales bacterium]